MNIASSSLTSKTFSETKRECVPAFVLFTLAPRGSEILGLIGALLQQASFAVRTENGSKSRHIYNDTYRVQMCKVASTTEAIIKMENAHKVHDLAWLGHLKPHYRMALFYCAAA